MTTTAPRLMNEQAARDGHHTTLSTTLRLLRLRDCETARLPPRSSLASVTEMKVEELDSPGLFVLAPSYLAALHSQF